MTTVVHCKRSPYDIYIGRPSKWGNPFSHLPETLAFCRVQTREQAIAAYRDWFFQSAPDDLVESLPQLKNKVLGCWCHPLACHGDFLAELANQL